MMSTAAVLWKSGCSVKCLVQQVPAGGEEGGPSVSLAVGLE